MAFSLLNLLLYVFIILSTIFFPSPYLPPPPPPHYLSFSTQVFERLKSKIHKMYDKGSGLSSGGPNDPLMAFEVYNPLTVGGGRLGSGLWVLVGCIVDGKVGCRWWIVPGDLVGPEGRVLVGWVVDGSGVHCGC